jgi:hypothetical protein
VVILAGLGSVACGSEGGLALAIESMAAQDLARMALPREELSGVEPEYVLADDSGFVDNASVASEFFAPDTDERHLQFLGRISGYELAYENSDAFFAGEGVVGLTTSVHLFRDKEGASAFVRRFLSEAETYVGTEADGVLLAAADEISVEPLGDESWGLRASLSLRGPDGASTFYATTEYIRLDRLVAIASVLRMDDIDASDEVQEMARALERRILGVLLGEPSSSPVP